MEIYAPVVIPTLCRFEHFKRCVESLARCTHADKTELIIGLDYPANESHMEGHRAIAAYIEKGIKGFKKVTVLTYSENQGVIKNFQNCMDYAYSLYDTLIFTEDDNEFSPNFLDFMHKGLSKYRDSDKVFAICGYNYPVNMDDYPDSAYMSYHYSAWGTGFWKHKEERYNREQPYEKTKAEFKSPKMLFKLLQKRPSLALGLFRMFKEKKLHGDKNKGFYNIANDCYCIFPRKSLVRNWGHDGSGVNCYRMESNLFVNQEIDTNALFDFGDSVAVLPEKYNKRLRKYFGDRPIDILKRFAMKPFKVIKTRKRARGGGR